MSNMPLARFCRTRTPESSVSPEEITEMELHLAIIAEIVGVHSQDDFGADSQKATLLGAPATSTLSATMTSGDGDSSTSTGMKKDHQFKEERRNMNIRKRN
ncbi:uncharacterized protein G2W53_039263 [Senna tora]|uniref:Uncharacterized protein n=1 Tax=Senna tora TaxID=362788 RepID=A0A834SNE2_9FABA|nr:uncharacterized protein G2W53_039263 [Senna tora]